MYSQYDRFSDYSCRDRVNICDIIQTKCCHILVGYVVIGSKRYTCLKNKINRFCDEGNKYLSKVASHKQYHIIFCSLIDTEPTIYY